MSQEFVRVTPLNAWHRSHAAKMMDFAGWDMPVQYESGIMREHLATRRYAGLFDVSHMGRFVFRGEDALPLLQWSLSNNAAALEPWQAQYTLLPDENGGALDDAYLYRFGHDEYWLVVNAANREKDWDHLREQARQFRQVEMEDRTEATAMIALQGPGARTLLELLVDDVATLPAPFRNALSSATIGGIPLRVARTGYTGEPIAFELFAAAQDAEALWMRLHDAGTPLGLLPVGLGARDTLRLEAGLPLYGHELGRDPEGRAIPAYAFPLTSLAVSFAECKGPFVGCRALRAQFEEVQKLKQGHPADPAVLPRRIRPLAILDRGVVRQGDVIRRAGRPIGVATSGTTVPYWIFEGEGARAAIGDGHERRSLALALLDSAVAPDDDVEAMVRGRALQARVVRWHGRADAPPWFRPVPADRTPIRDRAAAQGADRAKMINLLRKSVENHEWRQSRCVNLIASENTPSPLVRLLQISDPVGRYAEHREVAAVPGKEVYYYQGTDFIEWVEQQLEAELALFMGCTQVETRAISGQMANTVVYSALMDFNNRLERRSEPQRIRLALNNHIGNGGHLSAQPMGALRDYIAKDPVSERFAVVNLPGCPDNPYRIDVERTARMLDEIRPELVILGKSMTLHPEPVAAVHAMIRDLDPRPLLMVDMAHVLGLIGPCFQFPFQEGADIVTGSTHKTFFGSQRGAIGAAFAEDSPRYDLWKAVRRRAFPGMTSNHHLGTLLALLAATIEMNAFKDEMQPQVLANAKALAAALKEAGLAVEGDPAVGYTETHQVVLNVGWGLGCRAARTLEHNNIIVNYQAIPSDEGFTVSSGLRLGVAEMTRFGMREKDFRAFAPLFADALHGKPGVAEEVARFREPFQTMRYCFADAQIDEFKARLMQNL
jgi:aminomethyltransferase